MVDLVPCPTCRRHVDAASRVCPFCADTGRAARSPLAAALFVGAALAGAACGKGATPPASAGSDGSDVGSAPMTADAAVMLAADAPIVVDAPPPADAAVLVDAAVPVDAAIKKPKPKPDAAIPRQLDNRAKMPYGAPSARRRVV